MSPLVWYYVNMFDPILDSPVDDMPQFSEMPIAERKRVKKKIEPKITKRKAKSPVQKKVRMPRQQTKPEPKVEPKPKRDNVIILALPDEDNSPVLTPERKARIDLRRMEVYRLKTQSNMAIEEIRDVIRSNAERYLIGKAYETNDVWRDLAIQTRTMTEESHELAEEYIGIELSKLDEMEHKDQKLLNRIDRMLEEFMLMGVETKEEFSRINTLLNMRDKLRRSIDSSMGRRAKYLGLEVRPEPQTKIENTTYNLTLDDFTKERDKLLAANNVIEGEVVQGELLSE